MPSPNPGWVLGGHGTTREIMGTRVGIGPLPPTTELVQHNTSCYKVTPFKTAFPSQDIPLQMSSKIIEMTKKKIWFKYTVFALGRKSQSIHIRHG